MLWITSSIITRTDITGNITLSQKLLTDIEYVVVSFEPNELLIKFKNVSAHAHRYLTHNRGQIVELLISRLHENFNITIGVRECVTLDDAINAHIYTPPKSHYLFETKAKKHYQHHEPRDCIFALTRTHVVIQDSKLQKIWSIRDISTITALVVQQDQFYIQYHHLHYTRLSSPDKEIILANLLGISKESGCLLEVLCREPAPGLQVLPFTRSEEQKMDDYFVQKLLSVAENNTDPSRFRESMSVIQEYNANVPIIGPVIKEKKVILCIFGWLQFAWSALWEARPESRNTMMEEVLDLLGTLTRIFSSSRFALEEATNAKALKPLLLIVLKSGFFKLNYGVCALVQSMISHHDPKAAKQATINRNFIFTNDVLEEIMILLSKSVSRFTNTLATYLFTNLLECCLYTQIHSTDWQLAKILATLLLKNLHVLFELCRSPCRAVAKNLTILLEFVLQEAKSEPAVFKNLQDECRNHCALIWQVYLAVSTPPAHRTLRMSSPLSSPLSSSLSSSTGSLPPDEPPILGMKGGEKGEKGGNYMKPLFARVAGAMVEGNQESMDLVTSEGVVLVRKPVHLRVAALMAEGSSKSRELVKKMFPVHLFPSESEYISDKFHPKQDKKKKVNCHAGEPAWYQFFDRVHQDFEEPTLVWNDATRRELCSTIVESVEAFIEWKNTYPNSKHVWNYEEFHVRYQCLDEQLKVGKYYVNTVLNLGNKCVLAQPDIFIDRVMHKLLMLSHPPSHQVAYLRAITWCYEKYHDKISSFLLRIENMLVLLENQPQAVVDHVLLYFEEIFATKKNIREFVKYGGVEKVLKLLQNTINRSTKVSEDELGNYTRLSTVANILTRTMSTINPIDSSGIVKVPIPQTKAIMSAPNHLEILTNVVASLCTQPSDKTRDYVLEGFTILLEKVMAFNDLISTNIYKTGLIYFLLCFDGPNFTANSKLLQKIHAKQSFSPNGSILDDYLPSPMVELLNEDVTTFAEVFANTSASPILVWNQDMRELLRKTVLAEIGPFVERLKTEGGTARYTFNQIKVTYPNMESMFIIGKYYVDNLVDEYYWASWQIPHREEFFVSVCAYLQNISTLPPRHRYLLMKLLRQQYSKVSMPLSFSLYPSFNEWVERFVTREVMPNLGQAGVDVYKKGESQDDVDSLRFICNLRGHVETICEIVKLLEITSRVSSNMDLFMSCNGKHVLFCCLKCLLVSCRYDFSFRTLIMECMVLVMEWVHRNLTVSPQQILDKSAIFDIAKCTVSPPLTHNVMALALDCIHVLVQQPANLESLCDIGIHYFLLRVIMGYISAKKQKTLPMEEEGPMGNAAVLATRIFTILAELDYIRATLVELIMEENFLNLTARDRRLPEPLVFISNLGAPQGADTKWTTEEFNKVYEKITTWIKEVGYAESLETVTRIVKDENKHLKVGTIYVDSFIANPNSSKIPPDFSAQLVETLRQMFENQPSSDPLFAKYTCSLISAINTCLSIKLQPNNEALSILVASLTHPQASEKYITTTLDVLQKLLTLDQFKLLFAQEVRSNKITTAVREVPRSRNLFLTSLSKFTKEKSEDYPACILQSNILLATLSILMGNEENTTHRVAATQLCHQLAKLPSLSPSNLSFLPLLHHLFPPFLVHAFIHFEPDEILTLFDTNTASAEFIWNDSTRKDVREFVAASLANGTYILDSKLVYSDLENELKVCNVYLNHYNKSPAPFTVTSPPQFLLALFSEIPGSSNSSSTAILQAIHHVLLAYPELIREIHKSEMSRLISLLVDPAAQEQMEVMKHAINILQLLAKANPSLFVGTPSLENICSISRQPQMEALVPCIIDLVDTLVSYAPFRSLLSEQDEVIVTTTLQELATNINYEPQKEKLTILLSKISSVKSSNENGHHHGQNGKHEEPESNTTLEESQVSSLEINSEDIQKEDEEKQKEDAKQIENSPQQRRLSGNWQHGRIEEGRKEKRKSRIDLDENDSNSM